MVAFFFYCALVLLGVESGLCSGDDRTQWVDSSKGIHAFLTFDSKTTAGNIGKHGNLVDYVWGSSVSHVQNWRKSTNPNIVLSYYMPFSRDPKPHVTGKPPTGLPWWQENHPDLILYQCDRKTPAWECFAGEGCSHKNVPLDLTNTKTLDYQMEAGVRPAMKLGYNAVALDNYGLTNQWKACGSFKGKGGAWVQLYDEVSPSTDPQYGEDVLDWTKRAVERIHDETGLLVIPNYSGMDLGDSKVLRVGNLTDGILAESGFTSWNPIPNTTSMHRPPPMTNPKKFELQVRYVRNLQRYGKGFFAINEWGPGPDYDLNPTCWATNITRAVRQFVVASFMMTNGRSSGVMLTCIQCYGGGCGGVGNFSVWPPEFQANVGVPVGEPMKNATSGVWTRLYSNAISIVNPSQTAKVRVELPVDDDWVDLYGSKVVDHVATLPEASGLVLMKEGARGTAASRTSR